MTRDESLNVAYWNIGSRHLEKSKDEFFVNGNRLGFFHFSGFDRKNPDRISRFDDGHQKKSVAEIVSHYAKLVDGNVSDPLDDIECESLSYFDGTPIDPIHREAIRGNQPEFTNVKNPFDLTENSELISRFEAIRERLVLGRKQWQIEALQAAASKQNEWIQRKIQDRFDKRAIRAVKSVFQIFRKDAA